MGSWWFLIQNLKRSGVGKPHLLPFKDWTTLHSMTITCFCPTLFLNIQLLSSMITATFRKNNHKTFSTVVNLSPSPHTYIPASQKQNPFVFPSIATSTMAVHRIKFFSKFVREEMGKKKRRQVTWQILVMCSAAPISQIFLSHTARVGQLQQIRAHQFI